MKPTRINKYIAMASELSRRHADEAIAAGRVTINNSLAKSGDLVQATDVVRLDDRVLHVPETTRTVILHKPVGYVCSRDGQGSPTIYQLLPSTMQSLNPVGRLDKDSSGLLLLTDDGQLAHTLTHPSFQKQKRYLVTVQSPLNPDDKDQIVRGVQLEDGLSQLNLEPQDNSGVEWLVSMHEGRNRQIRRTFEKLGYHIQRLHRIEFGPYKLDDLAEGEVKEVK